MIIIKIEINFVSRKRRYQPLWLLLRLWWWLEWHIFYETSSDMLQLVLNSSLFESCFCLCLSTILLWCLTSDRVLQPILLDRLLSTGFFVFFAIHRPSSHSFLSSFFVHSHNLWRSVDLAILRVDLWGPIISLFSHFWLPTHWLHSFRSSGCNQQLLLPLN